MTLFRDDREYRDLLDDGKDFGLRPSRQWRRGRLPAPRRRVVVGMSALATVAAGLLLLTMLPWGPLAGLTHYTMPDDVVRVAERIGFTEQGRALFDEVRPELLDDAAFRRACAGTPDGSGGDGAGATIGCYYSALEGGRIAVFRPGDDRLADQVAVTAAHEFLHAAYDSLSPAEQDALDALLAIRWSQVAADDPIRITLEGSAHGDPDAIGTEEFAYLGTEIADAGPELEAFYAPWFRDRQAVVALSTADRALWSALQSDYETQVASLEAADQAVADQAARLEGGRVQLESDRRRLDLDRDMYNQQAAAYNALSPAGRAASTVSMNGGPTEPWSSYLARTLAEFDAREADLLSRQGLLDQLDADLPALRAQAATLRVEAERPFADHDALIEASTPHAG